MNCLANVFYSGKWIKKVIETTEEPKETGVKIYSGKNCSAGIKKLSQLNMRP